MPFDHFIMKLANKKKTSRKSHGFVTDFVTDFLEEILQYLIEEEDQGTLYSCILVNRDWCRITIPILWSNPFNNLRMKNTHLSIRTYISCLEETEKSLLINESINIPTIKPIFDYPKYLQIFKYDYFGKLLENFVKMNNKTLIETKPDIKRIYMIITSIIMDMIFKKSKNLRILQYVHDHVSSQRTIYTLDHLLYNNLIGMEGHRRNSYYTSLSKLTKLRFFAYCIHEENYITIWPNFFNTLANLAKNIQEIFINLPSDEKIDSFGDVFPAIANLIKSQNNLKSLEINESDCSKMDQEIIDALTLTQSNSLTNFKINGEIKFSSIIQLLESCKNLKSINMFKLNKYEKSITKIIKKLTISSLEKFCHWNPHSQFQYQTNNADYEISLILKMVSKNLKKFACNYFCEDIFNTINQYCINLSHLCLFITFDNFERITKLLSFMNTLSYLYLESSKIDMIFLESNILQSLSSTLPNSLRHLSLNLFISLDSLRILLINCKVNLITLELYNIQNVTYKIFFYINDYYDKNNQLKLLKLDNILFSKFNCHFFHIYKKKIGYKIVESFKPIWFDEK